MAGKGEIARETLKVILRDGPSAFRVVILEHRLGGKVGRDELGLWNFLASPCPPRSDPGFLLTSTNCSTWRHSVILSGLGVTPGAHSTTRGCLKGEGGWGRGRKAKLVRVQLWLLEIRGGTGVRG